MFFAIWWAWMNFTWFASAYDNDDVVYRLLTLVQITGVLILAAGVPRAFEHRDFDIVFVGYLVIRAGLVSRSGCAPDATTRPAAPPCTGYAAGESLCMVGWGGVALLGWPVWAFVVMGVAELAGPRVGGAWRRRTPWHPEHIAERYGLFTIIVLGETILSSSVAFQAVVDDRQRRRRPRCSPRSVPCSPCSRCGGSTSPSRRRRRLVSNQVGFPWGYGHYVVFAAAAAVGAGVAVVVDSVTGHAHVSDTGAAAAFTIPVSSTWSAVVFIQTLLYGVRRLHLAVSAVALLLVAAATFTGQPVLVTGIVLALLVAAMFLISARAAAS